MKNSKPSKADIRTLRKAADILREYERQQRENTKTRDPMAGFNARQGISAIEGFIRATD